MTCRCAEYRKALETVRKNISSKLLVDGQSQPHSLSGHLLTALVVIDAALRPEPAASEEPETPTPHFKFVNSTMSTKREPGSLLADLHDIGLKHGMVMVVAAQNAEKPMERMHACFIDLQDETPPGAPERAYALAAIFLAEAAQVVAKSRTSEEPKP